MDIRNLGREYFEVEKRLDLYVFGMKMNIGYRKDGKRHLDLV